MSEPKRYGDSDPQISCQEDDNGEYVMWTDYEKLRAENADLRAKMATANTKISAQEGEIRRRLRDISELHAKMDGMVCGTCFGSPTSGPGWALVGGVAGPLKNNCPVCQPKEGASKVRERLGMPELSEEEKQANLAETLRALESDPDFCKDAK